MTITSRNIREKRGNHQANLKTNFFPGFFQKTWTKTTSTVYMPYEGTTEMTPQINITYSSLAPEDRSILTLMKSVDYGHLEHLAIQNGYVFMTKESHIVHSLRFDARETVEKPVLPENDFIVSKRQSQFLAAVRRIGNGTIRILHIQAGMPASMEAEEASTIV